MMKKTTKQYHQRGWDWNLQEYREIGLLLIEFGETWVYFQFRNRRNMTDIPQEIDVLSEENEILRYQVFCKTSGCTEVVSAVYAPCGHLINCSKCANALKYCPGCHTEVKKVIQVNLK
eukprot:XP_019923531.1 PREDICTED: E3 ubiquitin-protein ligase MYLIP-A-like [Crassostrea gigas]